MEPPTCALMIVTHKPEVKAIADATADAAIKRWLLLMDIDASSAQAIKAMQADFMFMRSSRLAGDAPL